MANTASDSRRELACAAAALAGWMTLWWPVLFAAEHLYVRDLMRFALPSMQFLSEQFGAGRWPVWTPWLGAGQPWLADLAHQGFYPGNLAYLLPAALGAGANTALDFFVLAHSLLAVVGMRVLLGTLAVDRVAAWALALVYAASGVAVSLTDNVTYLPAAGWLPLALAALPQVSSNARALAASAVVLALLLLAGDVLDLGVLALLAPLLLSGSKAAPRDLLRRAGALLLVAALAALLAAGQLLPTLDLLAAGPRVQGLPLAAAQAWSLPPERLWELVAPFAFGAKYPLREVLLPSLYAQTGTPWFESVYIGLVPVSLALVALLSRQPDASRWALALLLVTGLALGRYTPLYGWAHAGLPLLDTQRYPEKLALWTTLCVVVLAGLGTRGLEKLLARLGSVDARRDLLLRVAASVALPLAVVALLAAWPAGLLPADTAATPSAYWHTRLGFPAGWLQGALLHASVLAMVLVALLWLARRHARAACNGLLFLAALDLLWMHAGHAPSMPAALLDEAPAPAVLARIAPTADTRLHVDPVAPDYTAAPPGPVDRRIAAHYADDLAATLAGAQWMRSTLLDRERLAADGNVASRVAVLDTGFAPLAPALQANRLARAQTGDIELLADAAVSHVLAPASRAAHWRATGLHEEYAYRASELLLFAVPDAKPRATLHGDDGVTGAASRLQTLPGRVVVETASATGARLVVRESWHAGWRVSLDARPPRAPARDEAGWLAVDLPPGEHRVVFEYHERLLAPGLGLSACGLLLTLWLAFGARLRRRLGRGL